MSPQQRRQAGNPASEEAPVSNVSFSIQPSQAQILRHHILMQQGLSSAVSATETHTEQQQEQHPVASATASFTSSLVNQEQTRQQTLTGSDALQQLTRQRQSLSNAMSATESNIQQLLQLSVAPAASDLLLQLIQQRQGLSNAMSATENNIQQLLPQLFVAPAQHASASSPVSQDMMLQGLEGPGLLQLLQRIQSQQGFPPEAPATANNSQPQLPVAWAPNASTSTLFSQEQFSNGLSSDPDSLQEIMQNIQSRQGLSSTAAATEDLAFMVSRVNAVRSAMAGQSAPSIRGDRADAPATASAPQLLPSSGISMGLPDDNHRLSEYQVSISRFSRPRRKTSGPIYKAGRGRSF
jgi:hypothetical protein